VPQLPGALVVPGAGRREAGDGVTAPLRARQIAALLGRDEPTDEQVAVVEAPLAPVLVVAGAGSGKTETMAGRVVWLLANGLVAPGQVLGLTFTRKAAGELAERVRERLGLLVRRAGRAGVEVPGAAALGVGSDDPLRRLERPVVATYDSYAASLVADHALRLGREPVGRLLTDAARWQLADEIVGRWDGDLATDLAVSTLVDAVVALSGHLDEHLLSVPDAAAGISALLDQVAAVPSGPRGGAGEAGRVAASLRTRLALLDVVAEFRARMQREDSIDFGGQASLAAALARSVPEVGAIERDRYRVVLLDEYQDTSHAQTQMLRALFGGGHPVTAVGDPHQSIYGWRGASAGGLERFAERFAVPLPGGGGRRADVLTLSVAFRNPTTVLDAANLAAGPLRAESARRGGFELPLLRPVDGAGAGSVVARVVLTVSDEAAAVAEFVAAHWRGAGGVRADGSVDAAGEAVSAAVLCRKRSQFDELERAMTAAGLPVEVVGLAGLLRTPEVLDVVCLLQAAHDPSRGDALMRLLTGARARIGIADLHALEARAREMSGGLPRRGLDGPAVARDPADERSIVDALDDLPREGWQSIEGRTFTAAGRARLADLARVLRTVRERTYLPLPELVMHAERLLGLDIEVAARAPEDAARARTHLDTLVQVADDFARSADSPALGGFLAWLEAADARERGLDMPVAEPDPHAVQLTTIHAAKGLEWDVVAVPGLVDGGLPAKAASSSGRNDGGWLTDVSTLPYPLRGDRADLPHLDAGGVETSKEFDGRVAAFRADSGEHLLAEERRLFYVAVTRARRHVLLTGYRWSSHTKPHALSPFLLELAEAGVVDDSAWEPEPPAGADNPWLAGDTVATWPVDPLSPRRREAMERAAAAVRGADRAPDEADGWDATARALLAEWEASRGEPEAVLTAELPTALSASALVRLRRDAAGYALELARPVPQPPSSRAKLGTAFHTWVERYFHASTLVDLDDLPGADDDTLPTGADLDALCEAFGGTPWSQRRPLEVEVDVRTPIAGHLVSSRIDAVFEDVDRPDAPTGAVVVVDWKTGSPGRDPQERAAREVQLAVYRLAWSRARGVPLDAVRAAFCYVATGETVYPELLLDEAGITALLRGVTGG
jgi:DNA helicase-2/ATP-dependent DNA helicase PcrA